MIDPKYADLPGIAYDQPDVYETGDETVNEPFQDTQEDENSIEKIYINASDAFNKFKGKHLSSKGVDFSDTISSKKKTGYYLCSGEWDLTNKDENETPTQRYQRLKHEIQEFLDQINSLKENTKDNNESKSLTEIFHQIESAGKELDSINVENVLNSSSLYNNQEVRFKELMSQIEIFKQKSSIESSHPTKEIDANVNESLKPGTLKYQMIYFPDKAKAQDIARISHLEKRLGYLENIVGISNDNTTKCAQILRSQGITKSIEKLISNVYLLNGNQLDGLESKVTSLLHKMDSIVQKKALSAQDSKHEKLILELYELVKQFENCSQVLPQTVDRMLSLSALHQKAADFATLLKKLENMQESITGSLANNTTLLEEMQKNFSTNMEIIAKDIASLNERVKKLKN